MKTPGLWQQLRLKLGSPSTARHVALQPMALPDEALGLVQAALKELGPQLGLQFDLRGSAGEIVLMDAERAARLSPQLMQAMAEERPVVMVHRHASDPLLPAAERFELCQRELLRQLQAIALVRRRSPQWSAAGWALRPEQDAQATQPVDEHGSGYNAAFDSVLDAAQLESEALERGRLEVLQAVLRGLDDPTQRALDASYGPEAHLRFDFRARLVTIDPLALQHLRVRRELPRPSPSERPQSNHQVLELDEVVWALGLAAGPFPLVDQPQDWWHTPLDATGAGSVAAFTRLPLFLEMARRLGEGALSPSQLRHQVRASVNEVRRFVQAALMLGLLRWAPPAADS